jgi:hypothetical protein
MAQTSHLFLHVVTFLPSDSQSTESYFYNWIQCEIVHNLPGTALLSLPHVYTTVL